MALEPRTLYHAEIEIVETTADVGKPFARPYQAIIRIIDTRTAEPRTSFHTLQPCNNFPTSYQKALETIRMLIE